MSWNTYDNWVMESSRNLSFRVKQYSGENDVFLRGSVLLRQTLWLLQDTASQPTYLECFILQAFSCSQVSSHFLSIRFYKTYPDSFGLMFYQTKFGEYK